MGFNYFFTKKHHHEYRCGPAALGPVREDLIGSFAGTRLVLLKSGTLTQLFLVYTARGSEGKDEPRNQDVA